MMEYRHQITYLTWMLPTTVSKASSEANLTFTQPHTFTVSDRFRSFIATKVY